MSATLNSHGKSMHSVSIGERTYYFSYSTCVAYRDASRRVRTSNTHSVTTAGHMTKMGVKNWPVLSEEEFARIIEA